MKQSKLRRKRVFRYAILYFTLFIVFMALMIGPAVVGDKIPLGGLTSTLSSQDLALLQPDLENDNTRNETETGTGAPDYSGALLTMSTSSRRAAATKRAERVRLF